ncbi:Transglycosylase SLT domain-containing protein [Paraburkholderia tuberum]|uniref:Transglycosylase SLT domain-containing protein n=2 Tax=Paraburkholderia tuberum TaxID=157910 RepID=A0A1H1GWZ4_9BURK|nr:Transglycosylase SLT domain-containing protein [Paraburkholderia tuberum]
MLGLDVSGYQKGVSETDRAGKQLATGQEANAKKVTDSAKKASNEQIAAAKKAQEQAAKLAQGYVKVRNEILSMAGVAAGAAGIKSFFASVVGGQAQIGATARNFSMAARELDAWHKSAQAALGGTAEGFDRSVQSILSGVEALKAGDANNPVVATLRAMNVQLVDSAGKMRPMKDVLLDLSAAFQKMPNRQDQMFWANNLGIDEGTLNMLRQGRDGLQGVYEANFRNSKVTEESVRQAEATRQAWAELGNTWQDVKNTLFTDLNPAVKGLTEFLKELSKVMEAHPNASGTIFGVLLAGSTLSGIKMLTGAVGGLAGALGGLARFGGIAASGVAGWKIGDALRDKLDKFISDQSDGKYRSLSDILTNTDRSKLDSAGGFTQEELNSVKDRGGVKLTADAQQRVAQLGDQLSAPLKEAAQPLKDAARRQDAASNLQREASRALLGAAREIATVLSTNARAAEQPVGSPLAGVSRRVQDWAAKLNFAGLEKQHGLPPGLLSSMAQQESGGNAAAVSRAGARGLFQFMPATAREYGIDPMDPVQSASAAARKMAGLMRRYRGNLSLSLSAYNWGEGNVDRKGMARAPAETAQYAPAILGRMGGGPSMGSMLTAAGNAQYGGGATTNHNSSEVSIGSITVVASDPSDGAKVGADLRRDIQQNGLIAANSAWGMA